MSLPDSTVGYVLLPEEGEAHDFLFGGRLRIRATAAQTGGKYAAVEVWGPRGFGSPVHVHSGDDEFFVVLEGEVRFKLGDQVVDATRGSFVYGPRNVSHALTFNSEEARVLLFYGPGGVEEFFRDGARYAATVPPGAPPDPKILGEISARYGQRNIGPPLKPRE